MNLHLAARVRSIHLEGNHDRRNDLVADFGGFFHVADSDMNSVPCPTLDLIGLVHDFLD